MPENAIEVQGESVVLEGLGMKEIPLTQGKVALVDDEDYETLIEYTWCVSNEKCTSYAARATSRKVGHKKIRMHRYILNAAVGQIVDHIDGNGLNNQKSNLHFVTSRGNLQNLHCKKTSKYPGVYRVNRKHRWASQITIGGRIKYLGLFPTEEDAFIAYMLECIRNGFELNVPEEKLRGILITVIKKAGMTMCCEIFCEECPEVLEYRNYCENKAERVK